MNTSNFHTHHSCLGQLIVFIQRFNHVQSTINMKINVLTASPWRFPYVPHTSHSQHKCINSQAGKPTYIIDLVSKSFQMGVLFHGLQNYERASLAYINCVTHTGCLCTLEASFCNDDWSRFNSCWKNSRCLFLPSDPDKPIKMHDYLT